MAIGKVNQVAPTAPAAPPMTAGQSQANQLAGTGGGTKEYMAARGATPVSTMGQTKGPPLDVNLQTPAQANAAQQAKNHANVNSAVMGGNTISAGQAAKPAPTIQPTIQPTQPQAPAVSSNGQPLPKITPMTMSFKPGAPANPDQQQQVQQWASHLQQMMGSQNLPPEVQKALEQVHAHFSLAPGTQPVAQPAAPAPTIQPRTEAAAVQPANSDHYNAPGKGHVPPHGLDNNPKSMAEAPVPKKDFKGRTTSMQRRGKGVGQPDKPGPITPTGAAQSYLRGTTMPVKPQVA